VDVFLFLLLAYVFWGFMLGSLRHREPDEFQNEILRWEMRMPKNAALFWAKLGRWVAGGNLPGFSLQVLARFPGGPLFLPWALSGVWLYKKILGTTGSFPGNPAFWGVWIYIFYIFAAILEVNAARTVICSLCEALEENEVEVKAEGNASEKHSRGSTGDRAARDCSGRAVPLCYERVFAWPLAALYDVAEGKQQPGPVGVVPEGIDREQCHTPPPAKGGTKHKHGICPPCNGNHEGGSQREEKGSPEAADRNGNLPQGRWLEAAFIFGISDEAEKRHEPEKEGGFGEKSASEGDSKPGIAYSHDARRIPEKHAHREVPHLVKDGMQPGREQESGCENPEGKREPFCEPEQVLRHGTLSWLLRVYTALYRFLVQTFYISILPIYLVLLLPAAARARLDGVSSRSAGTGRAVLILVWLLSWLADVLVAGTVAVMLGTAVFRFLG